MSPKWHVLRHHPEQTRLWNEGKRFAVVPAGRRSGKTEIAKRKLVAGLPEKKKWGDPRYFAAAPTREQAKRVYWNDLKGYVPKKWIKKIYETDLCITTRYGSELWVLGMDRPERIEGTPWDGGVLDEYANMKACAWTENIRPALADRTGWCWFVGVPEGLNHYKDLADYAGSAVDEDWGLYRWNSSAVLPASEIEAAKRVLDPRTFRQEFEASFEGSTGRAYYAYDSGRHEDGSIRVNDRLKLFVCCDFNVGLSVWEIVQTEGNHVRVVDEIALKDTNTMEMGKAVLSKYGSHRQGIAVYGDAAGMNRSTAGKSDYAILFELGLRDQRIGRANPAVRDRVNSVNALLENVDGQARLFHHPRCAHLKKDFETIEWCSGGSGLDKSNPERTHATDALGYFVEREFPLRIDKPDPARRFYK